MKRVRLGVLIAVAGTLLASGCSSGTPATTGGNNNNAAPATTAPVGADGKPITNLCDLLSPDDINKISNMGAKAPTVGAGSSMNAADCIYGKNIELHVLVAPSVNDAATDYQKVNTDNMLAAMQDKPLGGVDECIYGLFRSGGVGLNLRRLRMVVSIVVPKTPAEAKVPLIQMAAIVLTRANALGT
jgi:hypothetical protein